MMGQGTALVKHKKGGVLPTPQEIIKDKLKELALKYGWDAAKWAWNKLKAELDQPGVWDKLKDEAAKKQKQKQLAKGKGGGGGALVALAFVFLATKKKRRR